MFRRLSTKLTIVFAGMFAAAMIAMALATFAIVTERAKTIVAGQMRASGAVFHRLWLERTENLQSDAALLAKDFGFRAALASEDAPTIASALENLLARLKLDAAILLDTDGRVTAASGAVDTAALTPAVAGLDTDATGVFFIGERPYQLGATPLLAPNLIGWIIFAKHIDDTELHHLQTLSPIRLSAAVLPDAPTRVQDPDTPPVFVENGLIVAEEALAGFGARGAATLRLSYPLSAALAPYNLLLSALGGLIFLGAVSVSGAIWFVARRVSAPISALSEAASRMRDGHEAKVAVETNDELADLGRAFNAMS
ncbi:MAG: HAMP domain-containing protein, partial [Caulobacterales bacterium]|nr:HAMP domain-containing protein [Caulobacterales bacterium]